jgi:hypothetical protein
MYKFIFALCLLSPYSLIAKELQLKWEESQDAREYKVEFSKTKSFKKIIKSQVVKSAEVKLNLKSYGQYFWRVTSIYPDGVKKQSDIGEVYYLPEPDDFNATLQDKNLIAPLAKEKSYKIKVVNIKIDENLYTYQIAVTDPEEKAEKLSELKTLKLVEAEEIKIKDKKIWERFSILESQALIDLGRFSAVSNEQGEDKPSFYTNIDVRSRIEYNNKLDLGVRLNINNFWLDDGTFSEYNLIVFKQFNLKKSWHQVGLGRMRIWYFFFDESEFKSLSENLNSLNYSGAIVISPKSSLQADFNLYDSGIPTGMKNMFATLRYQRTFDFFPKNLVPMVSLNYLRREANFEQTSNDIELKNTSYFISLGAIYKF